MKTISLLRLQARSWYRLTLILCALTFAFSDAWGAVNDVHDFTQSVSEVVNEGGTINDINIAAQTYPIKEVRVIGSYNKNDKPGVDVTVSVGGSSWGTQNVTGKASYTKTFTGSSTTAAVTISFVNKNTGSSGNGTFKVTKIQLVEGASSSPSCSNKITVTKVVSGNGSFSVHQGTADGTEVANSGTVDNCGNGTTTLVVVPTPASDDYVVDAVTATNRKGSEDLEADEDGNYSIVYDQGSSIATSITVTFRKKAKYTISFLNNGIKAAEDIEVTEGENIGDLLPELTSDDACHGTIKTFAGWTTEEVGSTPVHTIDASKIVDYWTEPDDDMVLNALWGTTSTTAKNQFVAANETGKTASENDPVSLTSNSITLSYTSGNIFHQNTNHNFGVNANTYCTIETDGLVIEKVVAACSGNNYVVDDISDGTLSTISSTSTVSNVRTNILALFASSDYAIRMVTLSVYTYDNYITACVACTAAPTVGDGSKSAVTPTTATVSCANGLSALGTGGCTVTSYGFVIGTSTSPALNDNGTAPSGVTKHELGTKYETTGVAFSKDLESLTPNTEYFVRPYAINGAGIGYGAQTSFTTPQRYLISYNNNGGSGSIASVYKVHGVDFTLPTNAGEMTKAGHHIADWKLGSASGTSYELGGSYTTDATAEFYAGWEANTHKFAWDWNGGTTNSTTHTAADNAKAYGSGISYPSNESMSRTGYDFTGWSSSATTMPDADLTITAQWSALEYDITYKDKGDVAYSGNNSASLVAKHTYDAATALEAGTKDGYTFEGWFTDAACTGSAITSVGGTAYTANFTLYAKWTPITFTVAYNANGGSGEAMSNQNYTYDVPQTLSANTYTAPLHKYFYGWHSVKATADAGTREFINSQENVQNLTKTNGATVTLYAVWKDHTYTNYRTLCCTPLAAPANIEVSVTGAATATVTWDAVVDATGYEYKLGDGEWTTASVTGAETKTLSLNCLDGASDYTIYVRTNGDGDNCAEGTASAGTNFRTYSTVTATENDPLMGTAKVSLNNSDWYDAVETTDGTTIYLQATPGSLYNFSNWATPSSGTINNNQLTGWSGDVTVTANFVAKELTKLDTPMGMGLVGDPGATSATIKWNVVAHASGYEVVCAGATIGDVTVTDGVASCPLTFLTANTTYNWTVKALGDDISFEDGDACASQSFTTDLKKPTAIEITHAPTVTEYLEGESFAAAGMVVKVTYNNGDIDGAYSTYTIDPSGALEYGTTEVTITASLNEVSVSTTQAITVHKKYTLTFKNNGSVVETKNLKEGDAYGTFPSAGDACDGTSTTFMGWSTAEISEKQPAAPASYASTTDVMGTENVVLNAVWAKQTGQSGYKLVSAPTSGKKYVFVSSNAAGSAYAVAATSVSTSTYSGTTAASALVTISSGTPVYISTVNENLEFAFDGSDYEIVGTLASYTERKYLHINGNYVARRTALDADITWNNDKGLEGHTTGTTVTYRYLYLNGTVFDKAESPVGNARVYAFEKQEASYTDYLTTCCEEWSVTASYNEGSNVISVSDGAVAVTLSDLAYGTASYESSDTDVLTVAPDGKITGKKAGSATVTIAWAGIAGSRCAFETTVDVTVNGPITVTYNKNDGSLEPETTSQNATSNSAFTLDANSFSRTGYTFQGWATTPSGEKAYNDSQADVEFAEDVTLYAVWAINSHAVTLTQPTGNTITANSSTTPGNVTYGTTVNLTATENDGYVFTGWSVDGATVVDANAKSTSFTMPDNAVSVTATYSTYTWDFVNYTVTTAPKIEYYKVEKFSTAGVVIKENYKRSDNEETKQETYTGTWTAKLDGVAIANGADLSLDDNGKTLKLYIGEEEIASYTLTVNNIDVDQFVVGIWDIEAPTFQINTYTMPSLSNQTAGDAASCKDHNIFVGWVEEANVDEPTDENIIAGGQTGMTASNKTYYAVWAKQVTGPREHSIKYDWDGTTTGWSTGGNISSNDSGQAGKCGSTSNGSVTTSTSYAKPKVFSVYLKKTSGNDNNSWVIKYSNNNSTWNTVASMSFSNISQTEWTLFSANVSSETYNGCYFKLEKGNGSAVCLIDDVTLTYEQEDTYNTDYITDCETRYEISFDANGGEGSYESILRKEGKTITLPDGSALSKEHYDFIGWRADNAGELLNGGSEFTVGTANVAFYAQWSEWSKATVTFKNGEETVGTPETVYRGENYTTPAAPVAAEGKLFQGWSDGVNTYDAGIEVAMANPAVAVTYNALWKDILPTPDAPAITTADLANGEWVLVTANSQLREGDVVIVTSKNATSGKYFAMSTTQEDKYRGAEEATITDNKLAATDAMAKLFVQVGYGENQYALYAINETTGYLYYPGNNNELKTQTDLTKAASWNITINDDYTATIQNASYTNYEMKYNPTSPRFTCYTSGQNDVVLYKWVKKISGNMEISDVTLTDAVIVEDGATLTVDAASTLDNLTVEAGGKVETSNELTVNNLTINSEAGKSGQVSNAGNVHANNVYMDVTFYKTAETLDATSANQWYMISAPFDVNLADGFTLTDGTPMRFAQSGDAGSYIFDLFEYDGAKRASTGNTGWKRVQGHMPAGKACLIGFVSGQPTTIRLKAANTTLAEKASIALSAYSGDAQNRNWNGVANPNLHYVNINKDVQIYNNEEGENGRKYLPYTASSYSFVVGTAFFVQETGSITLEAGDHGQLRAPKRESERYEACVRIVRDGAETFADQMFVRASEEASNEYEQGHDMITWNGTTAKTALIWSNNYGKRLAIEEAPIVDNKASYALSLYAPADGTYRIETPTENEDATLYLTKDGRVMWNLSMSACEVELTKGTTENYGLLLVRKTPGVATGMENVQSDDVQCTKVIIDNQVFILRGGQMYDLTGKAVK